MLIRIEATDLPGRSCEPPRYDNVHVAVQRRNDRDELLGLHPGDAASAAWSLTATAKATPLGIDLLGPYVQGRPGARFVYLSWGTVDEGRFTMFRRAKLMFDAIPGATLEKAVEVGVLVGRLGLTDRRGHPLCAAVRPPLITWSGPAPA